MEMNRNTGIIIVICLIFFVSIRVYIALNVPSPGSDNNQTSFSFPLGLPTVFTGTLPCASCPGIETHLLIDSTGFREVSSYIAEEDKPFTTYGTWELSPADSLFLNRGGEIYKAFLLENDSMRLLDQSGNRIEGDLAENYVLTYSDMETKIRKQHNEFRNQGFTFIAAGNEPFWSVRVTDKDYVIYETPEIRKSGSIEQSDFNDTSTVLNVKFGSGETLDLDIAEEYCRDSMSGFLFTHSVTVHMQGNEMTGCGRYL